MRSEHQSSGREPELDQMSIAKAALALEIGEVIERGISDSPNMVLEQAKRETINIDKKVGWKWATL